MKPYFSIVIPVYNRPAEVKELLESLLPQTYQSYEIVIVEDGSTVPCKEVCDSFADRLPVRYLSKPNSGRSMTRNYGLDRAEGDYFLLFDSDCILPPHYLQTVADELERTHADCFGGPDRAHESFSPLQKAISFSMTSFFTTGGIRGGKKSLEKFTPRSFNMGFSRAVYEKVGGFADMFGEDIDLSKRIVNAGFQVRLFADAYVYHKRRVSLKKFFKQVYVFGMARIALYQMHPESLKVVHLLPAAFLIGSVVLLLGSIFSYFSLTPLLLYCALLFGESMGQHHNLRIAGLSVVTSLIQLYGYGLGFLRATWFSLILHRDDAEEQLNKHYKGKRAQ